MWMWKRMWAMPQWFTTISLIQDVPEYKLFRVNITSVWPHAETTANVLMEKTLNLDKGHNICSLLLIIFSPLAQVQRAQSTLFNLTVLQHHTQLAVTVLRWQTKPQWDSFSWSTKQKSPTRGSPELGSSYAELHLYHIKEEDNSKRMWRWVCAGTATSHLRTSGAV